ncbi:MAG: hypothetical protein K8R59_09155 [Thermoanaerobaculales bacterium]|nr:hypothetical protein [Thermoanaerobaculales bacterium]
MDPVVRNDGRFCIDLGGTIAEFSSSEPDAIHRMRRRFAGFEVASARPVISFIHSPEGGEQLSFSTSVDLKNRKVYLFGEQGISHVDGVLRTVLAVVAAPDLIAHAALLLDGERAFLCCGKPGAGKSTMAGLFPENAVCDELARVGVSPKRVVAKSLPYWKARPATVSLKSIFLLRHGLSNRRIRLSASDAIRELRRHLYWPLDEEKAADATFGTLSEVVQRVPVYRLDFLPDRRVWKTLTEVE